jgi:uncharacterized protein (TIGR01777 family)
MSKHVFITGGSGFIGTRLCELLLEQNHNITILSRDPEPLRQRWNNKIDVINALSELTALTPPDWVINLAGEPIADRPWTQQRKASLIKSRVTLTQTLFDTLNQLTTPPEVIISGSAIGYYDDTGNSVFTESSQQGKGFAAELCRDWEQAAVSNKPNSSRLCLLRTGVVLGKQGGMLKKVSLPFKLGLGGQLGNGKQWFSWIDLDDICQLILFLANNKTCQGAYNATSPNPVTNHDFTKTLGKKLHRPTVATVPAFILKTALGDAASLLLGSQRILPMRAIEAGFEFAYPDITSCLQHCCKK